MLEKLQAEINILLKISNDERTGPWCYEIMQQLGSRMQSALDELQAEGAKAAHPHDAPGEAELRVLIRSIARHEVELAMNGHIAEPKTITASENRRNIEAGQAESVQWQPTAAEIPFYAPPTPCEPEPYRPGPPKPDHPRFRSALYSIGPVPEFEISPGIWVSVTNLDRFNLEACCAIALRCCDATDDLAWESYWDAEKDKRK